MISIKLEVLCKNKDFYSSSISIFYFGLNFGIIWDILEEKKKGTKGMSKEIHRIRKGTYCVMSGSHAFIVKGARFVLKRAGRFLQRWLKYLSGTIAHTGEKILVCLGVASTEDIESWMMTHDGKYTFLAFRLFEYMLNKLGVMRCITLAELALKAL